MVPDVKDVIQEFLVIHGPRKGNLLRPSKIKWIHVRLWNLIVVTILQTSFTTFDEMITNILVVIPIIDSVYGLIYTACARITTRC